MVGLTIDEVADERCSAGQLVLVGRGREGAASGVGGGQHGTDRRQRDLEQKSFPLLPLFPVPPPLPNISRRTCSQKMAESRLLSGCLTIRLSGCAAAAAYMVALPLPSRTLPPSGTPPHVRVCL